MEKFQSREGKSPYFISKMRFGKSSKKKNVTLNETRTHTNTHNTHNNTTQQQIPEEAKREI